MLTTALARRLAGAGLVWSPAQGDRFVVRDRDMDEQVFVLSDMTIEVHELPTGRVVGFNGTVEWALDSVELSRALWLPRETQLRELLGTAFARLEVAGEGFAVDTSSGRFLDADVECAYALALLDVLGARPSDRHLRAVDTG